MAISIGQAFGWNGNPLYDALAGKRNALMGLGAGIASGTDFGSGVAQGLTNAANGARVDDAWAVQQAQEAERQNNINATAKWLQDKGYNDLAQLASSGQGNLALQEAFGRMKPQAPGENLMSVGGHLYDRTTGQWISPPAEAGNKQNVSLQGQWGQDAQGNPVYLQPSSTGEFVQAQVPAGVELLSPYDLNANKAAGTKFGQNTGSAQFDLPAAQLSTEQTLKAIQDVRNQSKGMDEQFGNIMGVPQQILPTLPASERAKFQVETNRLINRTFLEAREVLRGGGQVTDFESRKAEGAISNLEEAMARGDKALFNKSLNDLEQAVKDGYAKLQSQAGVMGGYGSQAPRPAPNGGTTSTGLSWSVSQ